MSNVYVMGTVSLYSVYECTTHLSQVSTSVVPFSIPLFINHVIRKNNIVKSLYILALHLIFISSQVPFILIKAPPVSEMSLT